MAQPPVRMTQPRAQQILLRILEQPELVSGVRELDPRTFGKLIDHIGLEDSGELIALATTEQLRKIFDDDLWRSERPGRDETFDAERFTLWLQVMLEVGESFAAQKLTELSEDLVTLALSRHILVINQDELAVQLADRCDDDPDQTEKLLESSLYHELDEHMIIARREEGWDAILGVLVALDRDHHEFLQRVLERCCYATSALIEDSGGFYSVLSGAEELESDAAAEREDRRAQQGYVAPSSAASFLALARTTTLDEIVAATASDPLTRAYFRLYRPEEEAARKARYGAATGGASPAAADPAAGARTSGVDQLVQVLEAAQVLETARPPLLLTDGEAAPEERLFRRALAALYERRPDVHARRMHELSYLANVLVAGASSSGQSFRPAAAAEAVLALCNLGFEHLLAARAPGSGPRPELAAQHGADKLFRIGLHLAHHRGVLPAVRALTGLIEKRLRERPEREQAAALTRLDREVQRGLASGKPWIARRRLREMASILGEDTCRLLLDLIDECPRLPAALAADVAAPSDEEHAARFLTSAQQLQRVQRALAAL